VTSADVADALNSQLAGAKISDYRLGDISIPVIARAKGEARKNLDRLRTLTIPRPNGQPVPLLQIAQLDGAPNYARIKRRDIERVVTVSVVSGEMSAAAFNDAMGDTLAALEASFPPGYRIELGGEVEGSSDANERLASNFPIALALMVLTLIWQFNSFIRPALILAVIPLTVTGFGLTLAIAPGANFGFMAILGVLALAGIVVNNAIILIDRIDVERARRDTIAEAIVEAGVRRLRPIVMTTCTTALGLAPIIIARDVLFYDLALVIAGGLLIGTLLTLIVIPCLYAIVFGTGRPRRAAVVAPENS
jgi:multidrug efflux pump subunit AcrB